MQNTKALAELSFVSKGTTLVDGLNLLKSIINELEENLPKKFIIEMKETGSYTPMFIASKSEKQSSTWIDTRALILNSDLKIIPGVQRRVRSKK
jgi:hypothetical protein